MNIVAKQITAPFDSVWVFYVAGDVMRPRSKIQPTTTVAPIGAGSTFLRVAEQGSHKPERYSVKLEAVTRLSRGTAPRFRVFPCFGTEPGTRLCSVAVLSVITVVPPRDLAAAAHCARCISRTAFGTPRYRCPFSVDRVPKLAVIARHAGAGTPPLAAERQTRVDNLTTRNRRDVKKRQFVWVWLRGHSGPDSARSGKTFKHITRMDP